MCEDGALQSLLASNFKVVASFIHGGLIRYCQSLCRCGIEGCFAITLSVTHAAISNVLILASE